MINDQATKEVRNRIKDSILKKIEESYIRPYQLEGAIESENEWKSFGFYSESEDEKKLVWEALYFIHRGICVIRVYRESPLNVYFSYKFNDFDNDLLKESASVFMKETANLKLVTQEEYIQISEDDELGVLNNLATCPLPPPLEINKIPRA